MRKKRELHNDLPAVSDPNYHKLWSIKNKEHLQQKRKEYTERRSREDPDYYKRQYNKEKALDYRNKNKAHLSEKRWLKKYGIIDMSYEKYEKSLIDQKNACMICNKIMSSPHVDHDHNTGKFRALLCTACNNGLGIYEKNKDSYEEYLRKFK